MFWIKFSVRYMHCEYFLPACALPFYFLKGGFQRVKSFTF